MRLSSYLGIATALSLGALVIIFFPSIPSPAPSPTASSTLLVLPSIATPITIENVLPSLPAPAIAPSSTPALAISPPKKPLVASSTPVAQPIVQSTTQAPLPVFASGSASLDAAATALRAALVNIICDAPTGSGLKSISGSGVVIDPRGVILTNAHIAQYFLFADRGVSCVIRTGSPAVASYAAELVFVSPAWVKANASAVTELQPSGDGEHDYALLAITRSVTSSPLPTTFPSIPLASDAPGASAPVVIASYGAQFLESAQIQSALFPTVVFGSVKEIYTFDTDTIDVLALGGSVAAQEGSSGGGVASASGRLVGTITTSTVVGDTSTRNVNAITAAYIRRDYIAQTGTSLETLLADTPLTAVKNFSSRIPALESIITANLK